MRLAALSAIIHIVSRRTEPREGADLSVSLRGEGKDDMKKLTFALACASTFALFADIGAPKAGFEDYTEATGWKVADEYEPGTETTYWLYEGASGSEDGSTVKAYGGDNLAVPTTGGDAGEKYLELSTEGGTLWRSLAAGKKDETDIANKLGAAQDVPDGGLYIDTMVQFTPTEDGGTPETADGDKLAIWLNVDSSGDTPVTNLMVRAAQWADDGNSEFFTKKTFVLTGAGDISSSTWYRLTVKAIANCDQRMKNENYTSSITGFQIYLDNTLLKTTEPAFADSYLKLATDAGEWGWLDSSVEQEAEVLALMRSGTLIPSLAGAETVSTLQAVGFKGSGALDNLAFSEGAPSPSPEDPIAVTPEITLSATEATFSDSLAFPTVTVEGEYVLDTDYTIAWNPNVLPTENPTEDTVFTVTVTMKGKYTGSATATFTVKPASTPSDDWKDLKDIPEGATAETVYPTIPDALKNVNAYKLTAWANGVGKVAFSDAASINVDAFLLNVANTDAAIEEGKANFKIPSITIDANGTVTVTSPDPDGSKYNGVITIKGSETVNGDFSIDPENDTDKKAHFFKAFLSVE